jgi:hypothetical protein
MFSVLTCRRGPMSDKNVGPIHWLIAGVDEEATKLGSVDVRGLANGEVDEDEAILVSPLFWNAIEGLLALMQNKPDQGNPQKKRKKPATTNQTNSSSASNASTKQPLPALIKKSQKRPPPSRIVTTTPAKKARGERQASPRPAEPRTPDQPTEPADPTFSAGTDVSNATAASGESIESQHEETTKKVVNLFVSGVQAVLGKEFKALRWRGEAVGDVVIGGHERGSTCIILGNESVKAINDGGLAIVYKPKSGKAERWPSAKAAPVLSFEVSSSKYKF